jgi:glycosyltransferase involved in cell wall biosynthesis
VLVMAKKTVDIVIPVYNEEECVEDTINKLRAFCSKNLSDYDWKVVIADNKSTDNTPKIAKKLSKKYSDVTFDRLEEKGRGRALVKVWGQSKADVCCYMDADLSTDIKHIPELVNAIGEEGYDIAAGSRNLKESEVKDRGLKRTIISKGYIFLLRIFIGAKISDAQCGFKAIGKKVREQILPSMNPDNWGYSAWFFDTELMIVGQKAGFKIKEIPVKWTDDPGSTVHVFRDAYEDIRGIIRLNLTRPWRKVKGKR